MTTWRSEGASWMDFVIIDGLMLAGVVGAW